MGKKNTLNDLRHNIVKENNGAQRHKKQREKNKTKNNSLDKPDKERQING